ncbi:MAG TPA: response regulator [Chloroflexota bacterium]|nr:response regulator [Chloroflexota bacterium]
MMIAMFGRNSNSVPVVQEVLTSDGWEVRSFDDERSLSSLPSGVPDLILVDVASHEREESWELIDRLKRQDRLAHVPIIVASDHTFDLLNHLERLQEGVAAVLIRPFSGEDVRRALDAVRHYRNLQPGERSVPLTGTTTASA